MSEVYVVVIRNRVKWEVRVISQNNQCCFENDNLISLYDDVIRSLLIYYQNKNKIIWLFHFYNQAYIRSESSKKNNIKNEILLKFNYNVDKIVTIKKEVKQKQWNYAKIWCLNKLQYNEVKEFLKMFNQKLKNGMLLSLYVEEKYRDLCHDLVFIYLDEMLVGILYDEIGLKQIITIDDQDLESKIAQMIKRNDYTLSKLLVLSNKKTLNIEGLHHNCVIRVV